MGTAFLTREEMAADLRIQDVEATAGGRRTRCDINAAIHVATLHGYEFVAGFGFLFGKDCLAAAGYVDDLNT